MSLPIMNRDREDMASRDYDHTSSAFGWRPISTAPKDEVLLLFGLMQGPGCTDEHPSGSIRVVGYYDTIDDAWALSDTPWSGPFFAPTHWHPLPEAPGSMTNHVATATDAAQVQVKVPGRTSLQDNSK